jgi:hypothetical protein
MSAENDMFAVVGDSEFYSLRCTGDYEVTDSDVLRRSEDDRHFFVMRRSEWERLQRIADKVDCEIGEQEAADERRGM